MYKYRPEDKYLFSILKAVDNLHAYTEGSSDLMYPGPLSAYILYIFLKGRMNSWLYKSNEYDRKVHDLLYITLDRYENKMLESDLEVLKSLNYIADDRLLIFIDQFKKTL